MPYVIANLNCLFLQFFPQLAACCQDVSAAGLSDKYRVIVTGKYLLKSEDSLLGRSFVRGAREFIKWYEVYLAGYPFQEI